MPATLNPYGLYVRRSGGARYHTAGCTEYPVVANVTGAMFQGAPVVFVAAGGVGPASATPAAAAQVVGTMQGVSYRDPNGTPIWANRLPPNSYTAGSRQIKVMVNDDPSLVMMVQATTALTETAIGKVGALTNVATGNSISGRSVLALDGATVVASGDFAVRIVGIRDPGTLYPDVFVMWAPGIHTNRAATAGALAEGDAIDPEEQQKIFEDFVRDQVDDARAAQGLPPADEKQRPGETDKQYQDRIEKSRKEREARKTKLADADKRTERRETGRHDDTAPAVKATPTTDRGRDK